MFKKEVAKKVGTILGFISGWGFFILLFALWVVPQPNLIIPFLPIMLIQIPFVSIPIYWGNTIISIPFIVLSIYLGIIGVMGTTLEVSETHRPKEVIKEGIYSKIRHPQYMGAIMAHIGFSFLFSGLYAFLTIPIIVIYNYLISWKEEKELVREFGEEYETYMENVPMFIPKFWSSKKTREK
jgi:protein-S-isoprenylcysteine O-methyltransferase Ste14